MRIDPSRFEVGGLPDQGFCPRCTAYLHPYATTCFACGEERGSALSLRVQEWEEIQERPIDDLLANPTLGAFARSTGVLGAGLSDLEVRRRLYVGARVGDYTQVEWPFSGKAIDRFKYLGGLEAYPHAEYGRMLYADGVVTWTAERGNKPLASFPLDRLLSVSAYPTVRELVASRTFGFYGDHLALFKSTAPVTAKGGAMRFVFADDNALWRIGAIGNRTGWTDAVWTFDLALSAAELMGLLTRWWTALSESRHGPVEHARGLGFVIEQADVAAGGGMSQPSSGASESLRELRRLLDEGLIDLDDFDRKKAEIMARL